MIQRFQLLLTRLRNWVAGGGGRIAAAASATGVRLPPVGGRALPRGVHGGLRRCGTLGFGCRGTSIFLLMILESRVESYEKFMRLNYEPCSEPLHISAKKLFLNNELSYHR